MGLKTDEVSFTSPRSVQELGRALQDALASAKAGSVDPIESGSGALSQFDDKADIEIVAQGATFTSMWAVQIYVWDEGETRRVQAIALGDGGFSRAMGGTRNTTSLTNSINKRDQIVAALR